ncbi:Hsp70 family chaperone [Metarhizium acridum CQMa 102]|uniref:Hsp70 family chaperone n=1 Tax=Metarhizium acridum (strain CQMa 102) TaxID=655827 RepID=E9EAC4_METAQ|nr:Hsp70 family chaperone [Metarhizium acridum CQMa 102]EFY87145.1 Hsp70 family chaperone [Metarhizium acridum CQMa 102]
MSNMSSASQTDVCISVDFGTTFTGVGWMFPTGLNPMFYVLPGESVTKKFPTILAKHEPKKWGLHCQNMEEEDKWRAFKLYLDQAQLRKAHECGVSWAPDSADKVLEIAEQYLRHLHDHIRRELPTMNRHGPMSLEGKSWSDCKIEFIFSVPTTWDWAQRAAFKEIVRKAGFGANFKKNDTILSIDMGGGTTDIAFVEVESLDPHKKVKLLQQVKGVDSGSMWIDKDFERFAADELGGSKDAQLKRISHEMSQGMVFQHKKLMFSKNHEEFFDSQFGKIAICTADALNDFLDSVQKQVDHVVLSGGLGGSEYMLTKLKGWVSGKGPHWIKGATVHVCPEPQLAVTYGLLYNCQKTILHTRIARVSIGVVPKGDAEGLPLGTEICWLLRRGQKRTTGQKYSKTFAKSIKSKGNPKWNVEVFRSDDDSRYLPNMTGAGVESIGVLSVEFTGNLKKRIFLLKSRKIEVPYEVNFQVDAVGDYRVDISGDHVNSLTLLDPIQVHDM